MVTFTVYFLISSRKSFTLNCDKSPSCEYLCIGNFKLYELSNETLTAIDSIQTPSAQIISKNNPISLPESVMATAEDNTSLSLEVECLNSDTV